MAELRTETANNEQIPTSLLQIKRWPTCHSLFLNLSQVHEAAGLTEAQVEQLGQAALPWLHCLHIIGRGSVAMSVSSMEAQLVNFLARHASVLTLQVKTISVPIDLPTLQHLVLDLDPSSLFWVGDKLSMLKGLKSLYLQSRIDLVCTDGGMDLSGCRRLQKVAVRGVRLKGKVALPAGCALHAINRSNHVYEATPDVAHLISGLTLPHSQSQNCFEMGVTTSGIGMWGHKWLTESTCMLQNLKRLQLFLNSEGFNELQYRRGAELWMLFCSDMMPGLEVLDLDLQCNALVYIEPALRLKSLVVITTGSLQVREFPMRKGPAPEVSMLRQMYLQSGAAFQPRYRAEMEDSDTAHPWTGVRLLEHVREEQNSWTAQMPAGFQPGDLQECCCGACPDCLVRAGVPVLCDQAWTRDGFDQHLRPRYAAAPD